MEKNDGLQNLKDILKRKTSVKPPAYPWQELALRVIRELGIPAAKRNSVFRVSKQYPKTYIEMCLNDTKELCHDGETWKYFFKVIQNGRKPGK